MSRPQDEQELPLSWLWVDGELASWWSRANMSWLRDDRKLTMSLQRDDEKLTTSWLWDDGADHAMNKGNQVIKRRSKADHELTTHGDRELTTRCSRADHELTARRSKADHELSMRQWADNMMIKSKHELTKRWSKADHELTKHADSELTTRLSRADFERNPRWLRADHELSRAALQLTCGCGLSIWLQSDYSMRTPNCPKVRSRCL